MAWLAKATATQWLSRATNIFATHADGAFEGVLCGWYRPCGTGTDEVIVQDGGPIGTGQPDTTLVFTSTGAARFSQDDGTNTCQTTSTAVVGATGWAFFYGDAANDPDACRARVNQEAHTSESETSVDRPLATELRVANGSWNGQATVDANADGSLAEIAMYSGPLVTGDIDSLASGALPEDVGGTLFLRCWPLLEDFLDTDASGELTENGVTASGFNISATHPTTRATTAGNGGGIQPYMVHHYGQMIGST